MAVTYTTPPGNTGPLTHWARPGIEPASSWMLVRFIFPEPRRELHNLCLEKGRNDREPASLDRGSKLLVSGSSSNYLWKSHWGVNILKSREYHMDLGIGFSLEASGALSEGNILARWCESSSLPVVTQATFCLFTDLLAWHLVGSCEKSDSVSKVQFFWQIADLRT